MRCKSATLFVALLWYVSCVYAQDITIVKHARRPQALQSLPQPKQQYVIKEGDTLRDVLTKVYGAKEQDLPALFTRFRRENPGIQDLNYIQAGAKIAIPALGKTSQDTISKVNPDTLQVKQVSSDIYVVKQGQHLAMILRKVYGIPNELIFHEYLRLVMEKNPEIRDPDHLIPGQKLKLPSMKEVLAAVQPSRNNAVQSVLATTAGIKSPPSPPVVSGKEKETVNKVAAMPVSPQAVHQKAPAAASNLTQVSPPKLVNQPAATASQGVHKSERAAGLPSPISVSPKNPPKLPAITATGASIDDKVSQQAQAVKGKVFPALERMGGKQKNQGTYFMPMPGGTSISVNTNEIPVMELDTGRKIIFDTNGKISPEMKGYIEKAFPSFKVISGSSSDLEGIMDRVLSVSGYFSVNKDPGPLLVGEEEKLRFFGKWVVYKDFSRRNIFVINILKEEDNRTPATIRNYAGRFGIDLIELGGRDPGTQKGKESVIAINHSYKTLFEHIKVDYKTDAEIEVVPGGVLKMVYKAPILIGKVILTDSMPDQTMLSLLSKQSFTVINTRTESVDDVLKTIGLKPEGPPIKLPVAAGRTELEIPAFRVGTHLILKTPIDRSIATYISSSGVEVLTW
jgi:hypothetical protein